MAERPDWVLYRTVEGLQQKAGVPALRLRRLVLKELADDAFDAGTKVEVGQLADDGDTYFVSDNGPGIDGTPDEIADLFSIRRPMRSSKLLRLPQRGAIGNGLRVVAGAVLASDGSLVVTTRNRRIVLSPQADGSTRVVEVISVDHPVGTHIEIKLGSALPDDPNALAWVREAELVAFQGKSYEGRSSPCWYDATQFHELILAHGQQPLRSLIAELDGCSGGKAGEIVAAAGLDRASCENVTRVQATRLLEIVREQVRPVSPERLGYVGRDAFPDHRYASERGHVSLGSAVPKANIPFVVEVWTRKIGEKGDPDLTMMVNRTPIAAEISAYRDNIDKLISLSGCGLEHGVLETPKTGAYDIIVNVTTPYCPIISDSKTPNLEPFADSLFHAISAATKKAQRVAPKKRRVSQKDIVLENLDQAIAENRGDDELRYNERQLFYVLRKVVRDETGETLTIGNFKAIITDYESEHGELPGMYREPRGSIYHPHRDETLALGTLMVEEYERPAWTYNKIVYIEKEGFSEAIKDTGWPERHDCSLISSKGFTTRACRDLIDKLAEHDEPVQVFCVTDADAPGGMIYQTFQEETKARGARKIEIIHLGLQPWEAIEMELEVETIPRGETRKAIADYVLDRDDEYPNEAPGGISWEEWLQNHRVELNAMTTPQFIEWLDAKMTEHGDGKLIPPETVIAQQLEDRLEAETRAIITERILREANLEGQVTKALKKIKRPSGSTLINGIRKLFKHAPEKEWRAHVEAVVAKITKTQSR